MRGLFPILTVLMAALATTVAAQTPVGVNAVVENSVQTRSVGESGWRRSIVDGAVRQADAIVTGADSRLLIRLTDESVLTVGANAALNVDRFVIDTESDPAGVLVSMVRGAFRFVSGSRGAERERVAFRTPTATIGIRGTIIEAAVGAEALELLDGEAGMSVPGDDPDQTVLIVLVEGEIEIVVDGVRRIVREPGQAVSVRGRRVSEPFRLSPEAGQRLAGRLPPREPGGPGAGPQGRGPQGQQPRGQGTRGQGDRGAPSRPGSAGPGQQPAPGPGSGQRPGQAS
ncbi:FecR family protein [uncultured Brevundimonas sp.]|uniref:FecR family protein n=1 Tax=uncultured Brevundimonas sp. TaxID=213418 RepID=UPI002633D074|nr:FecR family protein [uncultured Brevundimonas sp.]